MCSVCTVHVHHVCCASLRCNALETVLMSSSLAWELTVCYIKPLDSISQANKPQECASMWHVNTTNGWKIPLPWKPAATAQNLFEKLVRGYNDRNNSIHIYILWLYYTPCTTMCVSAVNYLALCNISWSCLCVSFLALSTQCPLTQTE